MGETRKKPKIISDPMFRRRLAFGQYYLCNVLVYSTLICIAIVFLRPFETMSMWWVLSLVPLFLSRLIFILIGWLILSITSLYFYSSEFEWVYLLGLPICMYIGALSATLIHNAAHYNFRPRWVNYLIGELCALQQLSAGYPVWRAMHFQHHAYPDDPANDTHPPQGLSFYQFINQSRVLIGKWFEHAHMQLWGDTPESRASWKRQEVLMLLARFSKVLLIFVLLGPLYFSIFYLPSYIANVLFLASFNYFTHEQNEDGTVSIVNLDHNFYYRFCNKLLFGVFFHKNHHMKPKFFNPQRMPTEAV